MTHYCGLCDGDHDPRNCSAMPTIRRAENGDPFGFADAINDDVIDNLTPAQLAEVSAILDKVK